MGAPPLVNGQADDGEGQLEAVGEDVDQRGRDEDNVAPASLGIIMLPDGRLLHLLLLPLPRRGARHTGRLLPEVHLGGLVVLVTS